MNDLQRYLAEEFADDYSQGRLSRRQALKAIAGLAGAAAAAQMLDARAQGTPVPKASSAPSGSAPIYQVAPDDPAIIASGMRFDGGDAELRGYLVRPAEGGPSPIVLVCHENRGLTRHIEDVTRRAAKAGYVALAVDLLSREGGTGANDFDAIPAVLGKAPPERHVKDFQAGLAATKALPFARAERVGMTGFCFGGGVTWRVAAGVPELRAVVPFYGLPVAATEVPKINAAVLAIYAGRDERINANIPAIEAAMKQNGKTFNKIVYPDVDHAFHNDTGDRFNAAAAKAAWQETLLWFDRYLKTG